MRITVIGAAGRTGKFIVEQAVHAHHQVAAVVRDPATFDAPTGNVVVHRADILHPDTVKGLLDGTDVVINAAGPGNGKQPYGIYSHGVETLTAEMRRTGVRRLVTISAVPASLPHEKNTFERYILHPILWRFFGPSYIDLRVMEETLRDSNDIDWTIVRPPLLTDDPVTGTYRSAIDSPLKAPKKISRADLATAMLDAATNDSLIGHIVTVSA